MIMPSTLSILRNVFLDDRERAVAIGVWSAIAAGGFALGPVVGGALLEALSWPWVFALQAPVVLLALLAVLRSVPESRTPEPGPFDAPSVALSVVGMFAFVWGVKEGGKHGFATADALGPLVLGVAGLGLFVRRQARLTHPLVDVRLFRDRRFATSAFAVLSVFLGIGALLLALTQVLQVVQGHGPLEAGLRLLPLAVAAVVAAPLTDAAVRRVGAHVVVGGGFAAVAVALASLHGLDATSPYPALAASLAVIGVGAGMASTAASATIMASAPPERAGGAAAVQETAYELGGALGVAVLGSLLTSRYQDGLGALPGVPAEAAAVARESLPGAVEAAAGVGGEAGRALLATAQTAFLEAMGTTVLAAAALMGVVAVTALMLVPRARALSQVRHTPAVPGRTPAPSVPPTR
jgi:DHA2 family multidrug resistance protein-like MFS transporter